MRTGERYRSPPARVFQWDEVAARIWLALIWLALRRWPKGLRLSLCWRRGACVTRLPDDQAMIKTYRPAPYHPCRCRW